MHRADQSQPAISDECIPGTLNVNQPTAESISHSGEFSNDSLSSMTHGRSSPTFSLIRWDAAKCRRTTTLFVGADELLQFIADLGPEKVDDCAGGVPHPQDPAVMCIPLPNGRVALIDAEDYPLARAYTWNASDLRYVRTVHFFEGKPFPLRLHRLILMLADSDERVVDHIDHDPLNNRKSNLRACTKQENMLNRMGVPSLSGVKGVYRTASGKWRGTVSLGGVDHYQMFSSMEEAAAWTRAKREELHGEFACHD